MNLEKILGLYNMKQWPKVGSKVTFTGTRMFWFVNMVKDANELLEIGKEYTIAKVELASSWCGVVLKEFPDNTFALSWFEYEPELTTNEQLKAEGRYIPITLEELRDAKRNRP